MGPVSARVANATPSWGFLGPRFSRLFHPGEPVRLCSDPVLDRFVIMKPSDSRKVFRRDACLCNDWHGRGAGPLAFGDDAEGGVAFSRHTNER